MKSPDASAIRRDDLKYFSLVVRNHNVYKAESKENKEARKKAMTFMMFSGFLIFSIVCVASAAAWFSNGITWYSQKPSKCPFEDPDTHVCSFLVSSDFKCVDIQCCKYFGDAGRALLRGDDYPDEVRDTTGTVHYVGKTDDTCSVCYSIRNCTLYQCRRRCCDWYTEDKYGRCTKRSGHITCQNGGTSYDISWGISRCKCPESFTGKNCETPICHCLNGAACLIKDGHPFCNCSEWYTGEHCERALCEPPCQNGGICMRDGQNQYCNCPRNFIGKRCQIPFNESPSCPVPTYSDNGELCISDKGCQSGEVCCKGHQRAEAYCKPKATYCRFERALFDVGAMFFQYPCLNCSCQVNGEVQCVSVTCPDDVCDSSIGTRDYPKECCRCEDRRDDVICLNGGTPYQAGLFAWYCSCPKSHTGKNCETSTTAYLLCPPRPIRLQTDHSSDYATLSKQNTGLEAKYLSGEDIEVKFSPATVQHCYCKLSERHYFTVEASFQDEYGNSGKCSFQVFVIDVEPPSFKLCPGDIFIFEDETPEWSYPVYDDNVAVIYVSDPTFEGQLTTGNYTKRFHVYDYEDNVAICVFQIVVSSRDTPLPQLPQGMRNRSKGYPAQLAVILIPALGCLIILLSIVLVALCTVLRRQRKQTRISRNKTKCPTKEPPIFITNVFNIFESIKKSLESSKRIDDVNTDCKDSENKSKGVDASVCTMKTRNTDFSQESNRCAVVSPPLYCDIMTGIQNIEKSINLTSPSSPPPQYSLNGYVSMERHSGSTAV